MSVLDLNIAPKYFLAHPVKDPLLGGRILLKLITSFLNT